MGVGNKISEKRKNKLSKIGQIWRLNKKDGTLRLCNDYWTLNKIIVMNRYLIP